MQSARLRNLRGFVASAFVASDGQCDRHAAMSITSGSENTQIGAGSASASPTLLNSATPSPSTTMHGWLQPNLPESTVRHEPA